MRSWSEELNTEREMDILDMLAACSTRMHVHMMRLGLCVLQMGTVYSTCLCKYACVNRIISSILYYPWLPIDPVVSVPTEYRVHCSCNR